MQSAGKLSEVALFNLELNVNLRGCDLVSLRVGDVSQGPPSTGSGVARSAYRLERPLVNIQHRRRDGTGK